MSTKQILVTGATGKQGGAVVKALLESPPSFPFKILALTRNASSSSAKALVAKPNVELLIGDLNQCNEIFEKAGGQGSIYAVFSVGLPALGKDEPVEEIHGNNLTDAALAHGVKHFVYTSVDRGGADSDHDPTYVPHFKSKYNIEQHLKEKSQGTEMSYTILRPVAFMDNLTPDMMGRGFGGMWKQVGDTKLQLVSTKDVGRIAALAIKDPEEYKNKAISIAGDALTQAEGNEVFWQVYGRAMPRSFDFVASLLQYFIGDLGLMFMWFKEVGYKADIEECHRINPQMQDLATWLKEDSKFRS